ncbi:MAG: anthranilate phosphoribosyltransferase [Elusimicrobiota bacterium]
MSAGKGVVEKLAGGGTLDRAEARALMERLTSGAEEKEAIKSLLLALNTRTRTVDELAGLAEGMRARAVPLKITREPLIDTCGTGGDGLQTFNISTAAALVAAGAGAAVAKHGNRSVSSKSGSADVLESLGVRIDAPPGEARRSIEETGFGFLFAPVFHPAMRHVAPARRELGVRTVFNLLGPLCNPARVRRQVVGLYDADLLETYARVLLRLGAQRVLVVHGEDGMDEMSLAAPTRVCFADASDGLRLETVTPEDAGLTRCAAEDLRGGDAAENARLMEGVLEGRPGPLLEATLYNAGAALTAAGMSRSIKEGTAAARDSVRAGKARDVLDALRARAGDAA